MKGKSPRPSKEWFDAARIWVEKSASEQVVMLRHTVYPFRGVWDEREGFAGLARVANAYLAEVWERLGAPGLWLEDIASSVGESKVKGLTAEEAQTGLPYLRWLPPGSSDGSSEDFEPRHSAWVTRQDEADILDRTAVLVGVLSVAKQGRWIALFGHQGIRVLMHVVSEGGSPDRTQVRITGLTTSLPQWTLRTKRGGGKATPSRDWEALRRSALAEEYGRKPVRQLSVGEPGWRIHLPGDAPPAASIEQFRVDLGKRLGNLPLVVARVPGMQVVANANVSADVFSQDLMARYGAARFRDTRPSRTWEDADWLGQGLAPVRDTVTLNLPKSANLYLLENANVRVTYSRYSADDCNALQSAAGALTEDDAKRLPAGDFQGRNRTDATSSVTAFYHANDLFVRLKRWKLKLNEQFRFAKLPLIVRYRYGMLGGSGKDGRTVNAQVAIDKDSSPWQIEARFGLADLRASPTKSPLGLACDPRWNWHEFGHVLLAGSVGELEFRFAHSAGDALAAILFDPKSRLAGDASWRGVTFPWVTQPRRRHDRKVADGWGWNGALYQRERFFTDIGHCAKAGYWAEQILSSTLFRLYRGLGGDAERAPGAADENARTAAAEYSAFLIAKAIGILGSATGVPALTPDQFVSALIDADAGTAKFDDGLFNTGPRRRIGGAARKVIRWAFQQQGLYASSTDGLPTATPGDPEHVDIHIADLRDQATECAPGTYAPIRSSEWQADPAAIWVRRSADGQVADQPPGAGAHNWIYLKVRNLGPLPAAQVKVYVWAAELGAGGLGDPNLQWRLVGSIGPTTIGGGAEAKLGPVDWDLSTVTPGKRFALLVAASCPADQANVDRDTDLPCAFPNDLGHNGPFKIRCPIDQLVAYDNNLGLRELTTA